MSKDSINYNLYGQVLPLTEKMSKVFFPKENNKEDLFSKKWIKDYEKTNFMVKKGEKENTVSLLLNKLLLALTLFLLSLMIIWILVKSF